MLYTYQIKEHGIDWEDTQTRSIGFSNDLKAVYFAHCLADLFGAEIRMTSADNKNGRYFK